MTICPTCGGEIRDLPHAIATHTKRCRAARKHQREFFAKHGRWPSRKDGHAILTIQSTRISSNMTNYNQKMTS